MRSPPTLPPPQNLECAPGGLKRPQTPSYKFFGYKTQLNFGLDPRLIDAVSEVGLVKLFVAIKQLSLWQQTLTC